jgi:hypothetical protein
VISSGPRRRVTVVIFLCGLVLFPGCAKKAAHSLQLDEGYYASPNQVSAYAGKLPDVQRFKQLAMLFANLDQCWGKASRRSLPGSGHYPVADRDRAVIVASPKDVEKISPGSTR